MKKFPVDAPMDGRSDMGEALSDNPLSETLRDFGPTNLGGY